MEHETLRAIMLAALKRLLRLRFSVSKIRVLPKTNLDHLSGDE
jgi:hypothetical protein